VSFFPCLECGRALDPEGVCLNPTCENSEPSEPITTEALGDVLTRMRDVMVAEHIRTDDARALTYAAEELFERMKAYADNDPLRSSWVSAYIERYVMKLGKLIQEHDDEEPKRLVDMSYARCGDNSDVYVYASMIEDDQTVWNCMNCLLSPTPFTFIARSRPQMLQHLNEHIARKHKVGTAILRLEREIAAGEKP
jgi:hypothetical protein